MLQIKVLKWRLIHSCLTITGGKNIAGDATIQISWIGGGGGGGRLITNMS